MKVVKVLCDGGGVEGGCREGVEEEEGKGRVNYFYYYFYYYYDY